MNKVSLQFLFMFIIFPSISFAHPTSFEGARGVMGYHSSFLSHNQLNYSWKYWLATGVHHIRRPDIKGSHGTFGTVNFLLHRWNGDGLQANIYGVVGMGQSELDRTSKTSGLGLLQFDIEDRNYYFLAKYLKICNGKLADLEQAVVRLGFAPYVVNYDGFHSWILLEVQSSTFSNNQSMADITPYLRFFYKNLLFELGQSFDGVTKFNYIVHF